MTERIERTRLKEAENSYGFEVIHEAQFDSGYVHSEGSARFWIDTDEERIKFDGTDSSGYDSCWIPVDAKLARAIAELLVQLANDLESGAWKKDALEEEKE